MGAPLATSERELARRNMAEVRAILGPHRRILWIEDRGYPAFIFWMAWDNANEYDLMRVPVTFYPEEFGPVQRDQWETLPALPGLPGLAV